MADLVRNSAQNWFETRPSEFPFHAVLMAIFMWLSPYVTNHDELFFDSVLAAGVVAISAAIILISFIWAVLRNGRAAGIISTLVIVCLAYYGHVFDAIDNYMGGSLQDWIFMPVWVGFFVTAIAASFNYRSRLAVLTKVLNVTALVLVLMPLSSWMLDIVGGGRSGTFDAGPGAFDKTSPSNAAHSASGYPDIYYLIFDRYADNRTLEGVYGYDNSDFLNYLRGMGFYVADASRANYTKTAHSLASSLNLTHLTDLSERVGPGSGDWKPLYAMVQDHDVGHFLKAHGYRYVHLGSWWEPTRANVLADENFTSRTLSLPWGVVSLNEFEWLLVEQMLPTRFMSLARRSPFGDRRPQQHARVQRKFEKVLALRRRGAPLFVFAHMLVPHAPFVFFPDGRYKTKVEAASLTREKNYIDQVIYVNRKIKELVRELLKKEPQPIIVVQSDEGPFPTNYMTDEDNFDWRQATTEELRQKFRILNAIYFPDRQYGDLREDITPVNTFRVIFNRNFGQNLPLLPDISYSFYSHADLYSFFDVTEATK